MTSAEHIEAIKRNLTIMRAAYNLGQMHAKSRLPVSDKLPFWSPTVRTSYVLGKLSIDPHSVTSDEVMALDVRLITDLQINRKEA